TRAARDWSSDVCSSDLGLMPALSQLAKRAPIPVQLEGTVGRLPEAMEAALFFVCSEALANVAKHAAASRVVVGVRAEGARVIARIGRASGRERAWTRRS